MRAYILKLYDELAPTTFRLKLQRPKELANVRVHPDLCNFEQLGVTMKDDETPRYPLAAMLEGLSGPIRPVGLITARAQMVAWAANTQSQYGPKSLTLLWSKAIPITDYWQAGNDIPEQVQAAETLFSRLSLTEWPRRLVSELTVNGVLAGRIFWLQLGDEELVLAFRDEDDEPICLD